MSYSSEFARISDDLVSGNLGDDYRELPHVRLASAVNGGAAKEDIAVLMRHVLRRESEATGYRAYMTIPPRLLVDKPSNFGLVCVGGQVHAAPWEPSWLDSKVPVDADVNREEMRRLLSEVAPDPYLNLLGFNSYRSQAQKDTMRLALSAPPGSTTLVCLPTGSGKSALFQTIAILGDPFDSPATVTVVVTPTIALALDQAREAEGRFGYGCAYVSGEDDRQEIKKRILSGTQRLVFVSPESALGSLKNCLLSACERKLIRALVVDEAHLVDQWGDGFRPEFQLLSGFRQRLMRLDPGLRTYLLTATMAEGGLDVVRTLFGRPGPFSVLDAVSVRPEPSFWVSSCPTEAAKVDRVLESIRHLPRPLILYATMVEDAVRWHKLLVAEGYRRVDVMTGKTPSAKRRSIIERWSKNELDVVVGTSAFGLGINKADVRAVVHACVPETIDRFYQEVGRGGRDGKASISLTAFTAKDREVAERMNRVRIITTKRGRERWSRMFKAAKHLDQDRYRIDLSVQPGYSGRDLEMKSMRNEGWNANTVTLLARSGVLALDDEENGSLIGAFAVVRLLRHDHLDASTWENAVEPVRTVANQSAQRQMGLLSAFLESVECAGNLFAKAYSLNGRPPVPAACGGCKVCRQLERSPYSSEPQRLSWCFEPGPMSSILRERFQCRTLLVSFVAGRDTFEERARVGRAISGLITAGCRLVVAPGDVPGLPDELVRQRPIFVDERLGRYSPKFPSILLALGKEIPDWAGRMAMGKSDPPCPAVLLLRSNLVYEGQALEFKSPLLKISFETLVQGGLS